MSTCIYSSVVFDVLLKYLLLSILTYIAVSSCSGKLSIEARLSTQITMKTQLTTQECKFAYYAALACTECQLKWAYSIYHRNSCIIYLRYFHSILSNICTYADCTYILTQEADLDNSQHTNYNLLNTRSTFGTSNSSRNPNNIFTGRNQ